MFFLDPETAGAPQDLVFSASDLVIAATCEYQLLRKLDEKLGRSPKPDFAADAMLDRTAKLGDVHEHRVLDEFVAEFGHWDAATGKGVYDVVPATSMDRATLTAKHAESVHALRLGADVVFQAAFFDGQFHGRSDFLVKQPGGLYAVFDTKLARHAKVTALLQLAAYGDQLLKAGITPDPTVTLVLGNRVHSDHPLAQILPVFKERRERFLGMTTAHVSEAGPAEWGDTRFSACGRCDYCAEQVQLHRDLLMVAGMRISRRKKLIETGVTTIDQLAAMPATGDSTLLRLREQAQLQTGTGTPDGTVNYTDKTGEAKSVSYKVLPDNTLGRLPAPDQGDIFFDFEGDPLWQDPASGKWGLEYLFGVIENPVEPGAEPVFRPFWAHSRVEEGQAFVDFLEYVAKRRAIYPGMHIYHYAAYEKTALRNLSLTHVVGETAVDDLLRQGVLVDLYDTVRHSIRVSENSYSIKKLEPLYMGQHLRSGDVTDAGASVVAYADFCTARDTGQAQQAATILEGIRDYNEYDCLSTLELRNWLLARAAERSIVPGGPVEDEPRSEAEPEKYEAPPEEKALFDYLARLPEDDQTPSDFRAIGIVAAGVGYHRREDKQHWWGHFDRLEKPTSQWDESRDLFIVDHVELLQDWAKPTPRSNPARIVKLLGRSGDGAGLDRGRKYFRMYQSPLPDALAAKESPVLGRAGWAGTEVIDVGEEGDFESVTIAEKLRNDSTEFTQTPMALTPDSPIQTNGQRAALAALATKLRASLPSWPKDPALDLVRRQQPRLRTLAHLPAIPSGPDGYIDAITAAVKDLDHSYVAVQGPPGSGKTHVGAHVLARLVADGWKVGVVAQSHAVVENMLCAAVEKAGVDPRLVAKDVKHNDPVPWTNCAKGDVEELLARPGGALIGGTAWTMVGKEVPAGSLDLLVIDEAGQFSLANTMAVSRAAKRLLLLGDPQQLPQVTQGKHPEPVDESALGWLSEGYNTLPAHLGYFLALSWRMHPELCSAVSELSYDNRLEAAPAAKERSVEGAAPGISCVYVPHTANSTASPEEAAEVVRQVQAHLGLKWLDPSDSPDCRPLEETDILVVAAYNAQVQLIKHELRAAGLGKVRVGTVDKFQGQEAPVVIVSMAASAAGEVPRGMEFLLSRNRINVAVSRGQWRAVVVRSPELTNYLPTHPEGLENLGGFVALCQRSFCTPNAL
ncbi:TM0106 family RecB-like putative nuclease [Arthrobacter sp. AK01]|uniref:TM0106 family RecB-like putative nuclease n=1 Tax=Arthrobacter sp. AK01 TaxID=2894084 RepID=UPI001E323A49|nr:TM0106 family RecB-like putative nuclease [Arthrobacter sp. AK01]MCD4852158.1 TM0106 family RecB-like putative nuclease [Arthrobacter sp. AK01]